MTLYVSYFPAKKSELEGTEERARECSKIHFLGDDGWVVSLLPFIWHAFLGPSPNLNLFYGYCLKNRTPFLIINTLAPHAFPYFSVRKRGRARFSNLSRVDFFPGITCVHNCCHSVILCSFHFPGMWVANPFAILSALWSTRTRHKGHKMPMKSQVWKGNEHELRIGKPSELFFSEEVRTNILTAIGSY